MVRGTNDCSPEGQASFDSDILPCGNAYSVSCEVTQEGASPFGLHRVMLTTDVRYAPCLQKDPYSNMDRAREEVRRVEQRVLLAVDGQPRDVVPFISAEALRPRHAATLRGRRAIARPRGRRRCGS